LSSRSETARLSKIRQILRLAAHGRGVAASIVETLSTSTQAEDKDVARMILLGSPVRSAIHALTRKSGPKGRSTSRPVASTATEILLYLVVQAHVNAVEASRRADNLSALFERWLRSRQQRSAEQAIMEMRSVLVSGVLGGVTAMISSLAPILSTFQVQITTQPTHTATYSPYLGVSFVLPAAAFLGLFFSPRRAYVNVIVASIAYILATYFFSQVVTGI
jgi:hypothetical protein